MRLVWLAMVLVSGCAVDNSAQGVCARSVYDDPTVKELIADGAQSPYLLAADQEPLARAKRAAATRCLQAKGVIPPGGVEQVIPER